MGEWSKTVGEFGEATVEKFLSLIGWTNLPRNISVDCINPTKHSDDNRTRQTHGIDFYYSYLSPLVDNTRKNVHISSKYSASPYPNAPTRTFKEYVKDLSIAIDCFKLSSEKAQYFSTLRGYKHIEDVGVLFWLSNDTNSYDDLIAKVATANVTLEGPIHTLYIVDNKRISFIFQAIKYTQAKYKEHSIDFYYPNTGKNLNPTEKKDYGKTLPVEYINSSVLTLRVQNTNGTTGLLIFSIDPFSTGDLKRLVGLSQDLSKSWPSFVEISFPDYNALTHSDDVNKVKSDFSKDNFVEKITVSTFSNSFTSINQ